MFLLQFLLLMQSALALQDDIRLSLSPVDRLFQGGHAQKLVGLSDHYGELSLSIYPRSQTHFWGGRTRQEIALLSWQEKALLQGSLSVETIADTQNDISFRLVRVFYDATLGSLIRLGSGIARIGYRHRCSHGADRAEISRILIRSGLDLGYDIQKNKGSWVLRAGTYGQWTVAGQNDDIFFQPRGLLAMRGTAIKKLSRSSQFVVASGVGAALISDGQDSVYGMTTPNENLRLHPLPSAAIGFYFQGNGAENRILLHHQRILDFGLTRTADSPHIVAIRIEWLGL